MGDPSSDAFSCPRLLPLFLTKMLGDPAPQALIGWRLRPLVLLALTVAVAPASTVPSSRHEPRVRLRLDEGNDSQPGRPKVLQRLTLGVGEGFRFGQHEFKGQIPAVVAGLGHPTAVAHLRHGVHRQLPGLPRE